jgi:signal transduction histidine kinase
MYDKISIFGASRDLHLISSYFEPNPKFLNEDLTESKARFILYFCFTTGAITCVSSFVRFLQYDQLPLSWYLITMFSLFNVFVPAFANKFGHSQKLILISMTYGCTILCLRILDTGGYDGSTIAWMTLIPIIFGLISDERGLVISTLLTACFLFFLTAYAEPLGLVKVVHETVFTRFLLWLLLILLTGFMVGVFLRQKKARESELHHSLESLRLTQKLASLGTVAGGVAHQVNNPLMNIMGQLELIRRLKIADRIEPEIATRFEKHFSRLEGNFKKINSIISALLVIGRAKPKESFSHCKIVEVIEQAIEYAKVKTPEREISLSSDQLNELNFFGNEVLLIQMFGNLLINALDATEEQTHPRVSIDMTCNNSSLEFVIRNSGPKIDKEIIQSIFDPFFTTKKISDGSGLGLVLSRTIAQLHGGTLTYDPNQSDTAFIVSLPIAIEE